MARIRYKIQVGISSTSSEEKDLGNISNEVVNDASGEGGTRKTLVAAGASDQEIGLDQVADAVFLFLRVVPATQTDTLGAITIKLNSAGGEEITVAPLFGESSAHMMLTTSGLTAVYVSNPLSINVYVTTSMIGD